MQTSVRKSDSPDQNLVRRRALRSQRLPQKMKHDRNAQERRDRHDDRRQQREHRHQDDDLHRRAQRALARRQQRRQAMLAAGGSASANRDSASAQSCLQPPLGGSHAFSPSKRHGREAGRSSEQSRPTGVARPRAPDAARAAGPAKPAPLLRAAAAPIPKRREVETRRRPASSTAARAAQQCHDKNNRRQWLNNVHICFAGIVFPVIARY